MTPSSSATVSLASSVTPSLQLSAGMSSPIALTRVALVYVEQRINLYLRFGRPARELRLDRWRRHAFFLPGARFARIRWEANDDGTTRWQLMVLQACAPLEHMQRMSGIRPGARLLLHAEGTPAVRAVLSRIDAIEAQEMDPTDVSPAYWRTLGNRLAAHRPLPAYSTRQHAAWQSGRVLQ